MKYKLLLFLLVNLLMVNKVEANSLGILEEAFVTKSSEFGRIVNDSVRKNKKSSRMLSYQAQLAPPTTVAGSSCGDGINFVQVNLYANSSNIGSIEEWFISQTAPTPVFTGNVYSPNIKTTRTYYVQSRQGSDVSTRVPVVASVYKAPSLVTIDVSPSNSPSDLLCLGTPVTFTAVGGAELFEFSVDGVVAQTMSSNKTYTTNTLSNGQTVTVRTRRSLVLDGDINEDAWGTAPLEDNFLAAPLSNNAKDSYINSVNISAAENRLAIGIAGKLNANKSILLFLDSKNGGFNSANFGDVSDISEVKAFNYFNNNPSAFDSYFQADYCLVISTDATTTNFYANIIELKSGESIKTSLGAASSGFPSTSFAVNNNNIGITDYNLGFEVEMLKSMIGYTTGDLKFFGLTIQANDESIYSVTNSFLSPELSSDAEYGDSSIDYNLKEPNPVIVASAALIPCYSNGNVTVSFYEIPVATSVVQPTCQDRFGIISIASQSGSEYSLDGTNYQTSNTFSGLAPQDYTLYVRSTSDNTCVTLSSSVITINAVPLPPVVPTASSTIQPMCGTPSGTIVVTTQIGVEYSLDGTTYQSSNSFAGLTPNDYGLYVRNLTDATCVTMSSSPTTINAVPLPPAVATASSTVQPTCTTPSGTITISTQTGVEYSMNGTTYQASNSFTGLTPGDYTLYVRSLTDPSCVSMSESTTIINAIPPPPVVPTTASVTQPTCAVPSGSISVTTQSGVEYSLDGITYQTSNTFSALTPKNYTLYVQSTSDNTCVTLSSSVITINAVPLPPVVPTASSTIQPSCSTPSGTIVVTTQTGVEYSLDGTTYQSSNSFAGLTPNDYGLYVRNLTDATCVTMSSSLLRINAVPLPPAIATASSTVQPTCASPSGSITIATQSGVEYSVNGTTYQASNSFTGLTPGDYTLYVRKLVDATCVTLSAVPMTINVLPVVLVPTASSVTQPTCAVPLGTIVIATQVGLEYSLNGTLYQTSNTFSSLVPNNYTLYVRNIVDPSCMAISASATKINAVPLPPVVPTVASVIQPSCATPSGSINITSQAGVEYSLNGTTFKSSNSFSGLAPNNYVLYVRNVADNSCVTQSVSSTKIDPLPDLPIVPTVALVVHPTCAVQTGTIRITTQNNVQYSLGSGYQDSPEFNDLSPGDYTMSVRFTSSIACITVGAKITVKPVPAQIQFESVGECISKEYIITASPLASSYDLNNVDYQWKDNLGNPVGTNTNTLNVSDIVSSSISEVAFPLNYSLTITSTATGCETTENIFIESVFCNIQKGISPDGNGSNEYFDLRLMDVKKLAIFDRYGIKVYSQINYTDQWKGQSDNGNDLPSATYYYVMEFNNGNSKTGWIYLIREK